MPAIIIDSGNVFDNSLIIKQHKWTNHMHKITKNVWYCTRLPVHLPALQTCASFQTPVIKVLF